MPLTATLSPPDSSLQSPMRKRLRIRRVRRTNLGIGTCLTHLELKDCGNIALFRKKAAVSGVLGGAPRPRPCCGWRAVVLSRRIIGDLIWRGTLQRTTFDEKKSRIFGRFAMKAFFRVVHLPAIMDARSGKDVPGRRDLIWLEGSAR